MCNSESICFVVQSGKADFGAAGMTAMRNMCAEISPGRVEMADYYAV